MVEQQVNQCVKNRLCSCYQFADDKSRDCSQFVDSLTVKPPGMTASPRKFHWIQLPWKHWIIYFTST